MGGGWRVEVILMVAGSFLVYIYSCILKITKTDFYSIFAITNNLRVLLNSRRKLLITNYTT